MKTYVRRRAPIQEVWELESVQGREPGEDRKHSEKLCSWSLLQGEHAYSQSPKSEMQQSQFSTINMTW